MRSAIFPNNTVSVEDIIKGDVRSVAKAISLVEDGKAVIRVVETGIQDGV